MSDEREETYRATISWLIQTLIIAAVNGDAERAEKIRMQLEDRFNEFQKAEFVR